MENYTYTTEQVAERYHRGIATINRWVRKGRLTAINLGGGHHGPYVFRPEDLTRFEILSATGPLAGMEKGARA